MSSFRGPPHTKGSPSSVADMIDALTAAGKAQKGFVLRAESYPLDGFLITPHPARPQPGPSYPASDQIQIAFNLHHMG